MGNYRILIEDEGTEGFGSILEMKVKALTLLAKRFPTDGERENGEGDIVCAVSRGWTTLFEELGVVVSRARSIENYVDTLWGGGVGMPDEERR